MVYASRLVGPPPLWEWQQPWLDPLLGQVCTLSRQVPVVRWQGLVAEAALAMIIRYVSDATAYRSGEGSQ